MTHESGAGSPKTPFSSPFKRPTLMKHTLGLKSECYLLSGQLILARFNEDWNEVVEVARMLWHLSGYWRFIEPFYVNIPEFFALEVE